MKTIIVVVLACVLVVFLAQSYLVSSWYLELRYPWLDILNADTSVARSVIPGVDDQVYVVYMITGAVGYNTWVTEEDFFRFEKDLFRLNRWRVRDGLIVYYVAEAPDGKYYLSVAVLYEPELLRDYRLWRIGIYERYVWWSEGRVYGRMRPEAIKWVGNPFNSLLTGR